MVLHFRFQGNVIYSLKENGADLGIPTNQLGADKLNGITSRPGISAIS